MSNQLSVDQFTPLSVASGGQIVVTLTYSADTDGFIVVNEGPEFDAVPGRIEIQAGTDMPKTVELTITRQPASSAHECRVMFTLDPASYTILVHVT